MGCKRKLTFPFYEMSSFFKTVLLLASFFSVLVKLNSILLLVLNVACLSHTILYPKWRENNFIAFVSMVSPIPDNFAVKTIFQIHIGDFMWKLKVFIHFMLGLSGSGEFLWLVLELKRYRSVCLLFSLML